MKLHTRLLTTAAALIAVGLGVLSAKAAPPAHPQGQITENFWADLTGSTANVNVSFLTNSSRFPNNPDTVFHLPYFEIWATGDMTVLPTGNEGDDYGDQVQGYFYAPTNGNYTFWLASDDYSDLYLSTDSNPANKKLIAQVTAWCSIREYGSETGTTGTPTTENVSSSFAGTQWSTQDTNSGGATITLVAGQAYYIETLHKEGGGGDDLSVSIDGVAPISGSMLAGYDAPSNTPTIASITGSALLDSVTVTYSAPVDPASATSLANYSLSGGLTISSATLHARSGEGNSNVVVLATSLQTTNTSYTLTVNNVKDVLGNSVSAATKASFQSYVWVPGWMTFEQWDDDTLAADVPTFENDLASNLDNSLTFTAAEPQFDGPWLAFGGAYLNYNSVSYAWFSPPSTGDYVFFVASDDASDLFLSTDASPANKHIIAQEAGYSNEYQWETAGGNGSVATDKRSDTFAASAWPTPNTITLTNGQMYYMEIDHHQGTGGAGAGAAYMLASDPNITTGPAQTPLGENLTGSVIGTYLDTSTASVAVTVPPANTSVVQGLYARLNVGAAGVSPYTSSVLYQWQEAAPGTGTFTNIPGATLGSYTTAYLGLADTGTQFRVIVSVPGASATSAAATVTVTADTEPPQVVSAGAISNQLAGTEIGVTFTKPIDSSGSVLAHYSLDNGATITAARYVPSSSGVTEIVPDEPGGTRLPDTQSGVVLSVSPLNPATTYHLTVSGIKDVFGISMASAGTVPVTISPFTWVSLGDTVTNTANPNGATNEVVAVGPNSFNLVNGGNAFWGTEDDITMVYETVKGDFDRTVQVEWSDPASHWARAGISARASVTPSDVLPIVNTTAPEYQMVISDPETNIVYGSIPDSPANDQYESNRRLGTGDPTTSTPGEGNPHYPASYVRLKRVGNYISMFYSSSTNDVKWWYPIGMSDFNGATDINGNPAPLPDTLFVGPTYGCENGNIDGQDGGSLEFTGTFAARFRNYETFPQKARGTATLAIGFNFGNSSVDTQPTAGAGIINGQSAATLLSSNDIAGVDAVAQGNWNNMFDGGIASLLGTNWTQTIYSEDEKTGVATSNSIIIGTSGSPNLWTTQGPGSDNTTAGNGQMMTGEDAVLMTGYLDSAGAGATDVGITNIPAAMTSQGYDVVVYCMGSVSGRGGGYAILDTNGNAIQGYYTVQTPATPAGYVQATPSVPTANSTNWEVGTYVVFTNLTASTITVEANTLLYGFSATARAPINAIQLISPTGLLSGPPIVGNNPTITVTAQGVITYTGVLRSGTSIAGPFTPVSGATSPYTIPAAGGTRFFVATAN